MHVSDEMFYDFLTFSRERHFADKSRRMGNERQRRYPTWSQTMISQTQSPILASRRLLIYKELAPPKNKGCL